MGRMPTSPQALPAAHSPPDRQTVAVIKPCIRSTQDQSLSPR